MLFCPSSIIKCTILFYLYERFYRYRNKIKHIKFIFIHKATICSEFAICPLWDNKCKTELTYRRKASWKFTQKINMNYFNLKSLLMPNNWYIIYIRTPYKIRLYNWNKIFWRCMTYISYFFIFNTRCNFKLSYYRSMFMIHFRNNFVYIYKIL